LHSISSRNFESGDSESESWAGEIRGDGSALKLKPKTLTPFERICLPQTKGRDSSVNFHTLIWSIVLDFTWESKGYLAQESKVNVAISNSLKTMWDLFDIHVDVVG
jgi:hypothetical protein